MSARIAAPGALPLQPTLEDLLDLAGHRHGHQVMVSPWDLPGTTGRKAVCSACGQLVRDGREVGLDGLILCRPCAGQAYFVPL